MSRPSTSLLLPTALLAALSVSLAACHQNQEKLRRVPGIAVSERLAPANVLTERRRIQWPPSRDPNRFLSGWMPWSQQGQGYLSGTASGARLQIVFLAQRKRTLTLDFHPGETPSPIEVSVNGKPLGSFQMERRLRIPLPPVLPIGRSLIEIKRPPGDETPFDLTGASLQPALAPGTVERHGSSIAQSPTSRLELYHRVAAGERLAGWFEPPLHPGAREVFTLRVLTQNGKVAAHFRWSAASHRHFWWPLSSHTTRRIDLPIEAAAGNLVRLALDARGEGSSARWRDLRWRGAAPSAPGDDSRQSPQPPRIVVIFVLDAMRATSVRAISGAPKGKSPTPNLDRLASEGALFRRHYAVAPSTLPSTKALLTGRVYLRKGLLRKRAHLPPTAWLADAFRRAGYRTVMISANPYVGPAFGLDHGFDRVIPELLPIETRTKRVVNDSAGRVVDAALRWIESAPRHERAFLYLHTLNPHNPYTAPGSGSGNAGSRAASTISGTTQVLTAIRRKKLSIKITDRPRLAALYTSGVRYADAQLERLTAALARRFGSADVLLVITADHGEELLDHGGVLHGYTLYHELLHIPLIVYGPHWIQPHATRQVTTTLDLYRTLLSLIDQQPTPDCSGRSLIPLLEGEKEPLPAVDRLAAAPRVRSGLYAISDGRFKVILAAQSESHWGMGFGRGRSIDSEYLFDLNADPKELHNIVGSGGFDEVRLRAELERRMAESRRVLGKSVVNSVDPETQRRLRALGYVQ